MDPARLSIRDARTDADIEEFRRVRQAVEPGERVPPVEVLRAMARPARMVVLAELDGEVVGSGVADNSDMAGLAAVTPRVMPQARRRGVGTALLRVLVAHAATLGHPAVISHADDPGALAFAERFGFTEFDRQVEQVWTVGPVPPFRAPDGVEIIAVADRAGVWREAYHRVATQAFQDMALVAPMHATPDDWEQLWITRPDATFVALAGGEVIGCAGLLPDEDHPHRAENGLTAVRRDWRGRGVAAALKRTTMAWAAAHGLREVYTWTQRGNDDMRRLNRHLGYRDGAQSISMRATLPLDA